jgi:hypothetical protein
LAQFRDRAGQLVLLRATRRSSSLCAEEARLLSQATASLIETGYDNWNGGTDIYILTLEVPIEIYARAEDGREKLEKAILQRISDLIRTESGVGISQVVISPHMEEAEQPSEDEPADKEAVPAFWTPGYFRLFLSHPSQSKKGAHALKEALAEYQIAAFVAHDDIEPTREWQAEIESALRTMDALGAVLTDDFVASKWCDQEVGFALGRGKLVVPLRAGADPHGFLGKHQGLMIKGDKASDIAPRLSEILVSNSQSSSRMADALIERLITSTGWERSRLTMGLLEKVTFLNRTQVARLAQAPSLNSEVALAFTVPARIDALIARAGQPDAG